VLVFPAGAGREAGWSYAIQGVDKGDLSRDILTLAGDRVYLGWFPGRRPDVAVALKFLTGGLLDSEEQ
jgi:hypothetical protein